MAEQTLAEKAHSDLIAQYEDDTPAESPPAVEAKPSKTTPPKDPETGRFVKLEALVDMAKDFGFSDDEIGAMEPAELANTVKHLNRRERERVKQLENDNINAFSALQQARTAKPATEEPAPPAEPHLGIDETLYDPDFLKPIKAVFQTLSNRIAKVEQENASLRQHINYNEARSMQERLDNAFAKHSAVLGKGTRKELSDDSADLLKRRAVMGIVEGPLKDKPGDLEGKIDKAVEILYGKRARVADEPEPEGELNLEQRRWSEAALTRPTNRESGPEPKGRRLAEKKVADWMRANAAVNGTVDEPAGQGEYDIE